MERTDRPQHPGRRRGSPATRRTRADALRGADLTGVAGGFLVDSPGGRVGVLVDVRTIAADHRRVEALVVSAGGSLGRVLVIPASEIREVSAALHRIVLCSSPSIIGTESAAAAGYTAAAALTA